MLRYTLYFLGGVCACAAEPASMAVAARASAQVLRVVRNFMFPPCGIRMIRYLGLFSAAEAAAFEEEREVVAQQHQGDENHDAVDDRAPAFRDAERRDDRRQRGQQDRAGRGA